MTKFEIPLSPEPQTFSITLAGVEYNLTLVWNVKSNCWQLNIDDVNGIRILSNIPLVCGSNLLEQFDYLVFGGQLIAETDSELTTPPTFENIGQLGHLYFITE